MLERDDYGRIAGKVLDAFFANPPKDKRDLILRTTSGTTGGKMVFSLQDQRKSPSILRSWYWGSKRTLVCYGSSPVRLASAVGQFSDPDPNKRLLVIDVSDLTPAFTTLLADFKPDRVIGFPSFIARAAQYFDEGTARGVTTIRSVGEALDDDLMRSLRTAFPNATFGTIYHMTEIGAVSLDQCGKAPLSYFHPQPGIEIEIHEPDEDGIGDILVSATLFGGVRLEKYRCGDIGRMHAGICPCGEHITFEVLGRRGYDFIKVAGALLVKAEFDRVMAFFPAITDYRVEATTEGDALKGKLSIRLFAKVRPTEELRKEIEETLPKKLFLTQNDTLARLVKRGAFVPPVFIWNDEPFPATAKPVKLKRV